MNKIKLDKVQKHMRSNTSDIKSYSRKKVCSERAIKGSKPLTLSFKEKPLATFKKWRLNFTFNIILINYALILYFVPFSNKSKFSITSQFDTDFTPTKTTLYDMIRRAWRCTARVMSTRVITQRPHS